MNPFLIILSILPAGTVRDETTFFILVGIVITLIIAAMILRKRRLSQNDDYDDINREQI
ncbi:MAG: hypothetical protein DA328_02180 [Nitrososphaeraceae archaeon]|nr:hypothetical protein [Nitrososphaeraceae archaeon]